MTATKTAKPQAPAPPETPAEPASASTPPPEKKFLTLPKGFGPLAGREFATIEEAEAEAKRLTTADTEYVVYQPWSTFRQKPVKPQVERLTETA